MATSRGSSRLDKQLADHIISVGMACAGIGGRLQGRRTQGEQMHRARPTGERRRTRADLLQAEIADAIVRGRFLPGARLDEQGLADTFGTSRTPVREALRHLTVTGLVEMRPHRGAVVRTITADELSHLFETMAELEAGCAHYAALRMSPAERAALQALHDGAEALAAARDPERYASYNLEFNGTIYTGTANPHLAETTLAVRTRVAPYRGAQFRIPDRALSSQVEHALVVGAIVAGAAPRAAAQMRDHVLTVRDASLRFMRESQPIVWR
jgi:DNA-binding GntR family transcriptional regulator